MRRREETRRARWGRGEAFRRPAMCKRDGFELRIASLAAADCEGGARRSLQAPQSAHASSTLPPRFTTSLPSPWPPCAG